MLCGSRTRTRGRFWELHGAPERLTLDIDADTAGATHGLVDYCREARMRFSIGYELTEKVRAAILTIPTDAWIGALDQDGAVR